MLNLSKLPTKFPNIKITMHETANNEHEPIKQ